MDVPLPVHKIPFKAELMKGRTFFEIVKFRAFAFSNTFMVIRTRGHDRERRFCGSL